MKTPNNPNCPKCHKKMAKSSTTPGGKVRYICRGTSGDRTYCYTTTSDGVLRDQASRVKAKKAPARFARPLGESGEARRYVITAAQNATPVHQGFLNALLVYAKTNNAELIIIPLRYKNPTSRWSASQANDEQWDSAVQAYLYNQRKKLNAHLVLLGDVKAQPTASSPLTGFEGLTGAESSILGHTKMQLKVIPVPAGRFPKIMTTTGACTLPNYTDSKAGKLGEFHHTLGAVVVEVRGKRFHLRQIHAAKDGSFTDLATQYTPKNSRLAPQALALIMGDTHVRFTSKNVQRATFGPGGMVDTINPKTLVWHDVLDGYAVNPHHAGNPFIAAAKHSVGYGNVKREVEDTVAYIDRHTVGRESIVVASNHDNMLSRWAVSADWKHLGLDNAKFYLATVNHMLHSAEMTNTGASYADPFIYWVSRMSVNKQVRCLAVDESFAPAGIECGMHGDRGPNGSRGNIKNLRRLGSRVVVAHSHSPGIDEGAYQVGTSTELRAEYTHGPSSWLQAHCVIYASGKRSLLFIIDGEWRSA